MRLKNIKMTAAAAVLLALVLMLTACGDPGNNAGGNNSDVPKNETIEPDDKSNTVPTPGGNTDNTTDPDADLTPVERAYKHLSEMCAALREKGEGRIVLSKNVVSTASFIGGGPSYEERSFGSYDTSFYTDSSGRICFVRLSDREGMGVYAGELQQNGVHYDYYLRTHDDGTREWVESIATANASELPALEKLMLYPPEGFEIDNIIREGNSYKLVLAKGFYRVLAEDSSVDPALYTLMDIDAVYSFGDDGALTGCTWTYTEAWGDGTASYRNKVKAELKLDTESELLPPTWFRDDTNYVRPEYADITETAREYHVNIPGKIIFDVRIPKIKDSLPGADSINKRIGEACEFELTMDEASLNELSFDYYAIRTADYEVCRFGNYYELIITTQDGLAYGSGTNVQYYVFIYDAVGSREADAESFLQKMGYTKETFLEAADADPEYETVTGKKLTEVFTYEELLERFYFDKDQNLIFVTDLSF